MILVLRIAHLSIAPQEGNLEVGNCEGNRLDGGTDVGVDVPDQSVGSHLDRLPLDHDLLHAAGVVDLVPADAELARPGQHRLEKLSNKLDLG